MADAGNGMGMAVRVSRLEVPQLKTCLSEELPGEGLLLLETCGLFRKGPRVCVDTCIFALISQWRVEGQGGRLLERVFGNSRELCVAAVWPQVDVGWCHQMRSGSYP